MEPLESPVDAPGDARRARVLESALRTFARRGYRRTSVDEVADEARISRPGLYLWFGSKQRLLQAAVEHALATDVGEAERVLGEEHEPLRDRLLVAFDLWAGKYTGALATDLEGLLAQDATLLGDVPSTYRARFRAAVERAVAPVALADRPSSGRPDAAAVADVLLALAAGTKQQAADRADFATRFRLGLDLLLRLARVDV